jgi:hypothetical protein
MGWTPSSDTNVVLRGQAFPIQANQDSNHRGTAHWASFDDGYALPNLHHSAAESSSGAFS